MILILALSITVKDFPNRTKIPNFDSNNRIVNYTITKREVVVNGTSKVFKKVINANDVKPFYEFFLPEKNVISITSLIQKDGTSYSSPPTYDEFITSPDKWYEVDAHRPKTQFLLKTRQKHPINPVLKLVNT